MEAVQLARKMEMDGAEFYSSSAQSAANPQARRLFESFAADERRHLDIVERLSKGLGVDVAGMPMPAQSISTVFAGAGTTSGEGATVTADESRAIETALEMERKSYRLYEDAAGKSEDDAQRALFERLAQEEDQHYEMLENTREYVSRSGQWFLWTEHGLLTGDMSSLGT